MKGDIGPGSDDRPCSDANNLRHRALPPAATGQNRTQRLQPDHQPGLVAASYSARIRALYSAVNVRRFAFGSTSGSGRPVDAEARGASRTKR